MVQNDAGKLTRNQSRALKAILEYPTITQAAEAIGLNRNTLSRYLQDPVFRSELRKSIQALTDGAGALLAGGQTKALATIYELMSKARSESNRRLAAQAWVDLHLKYQGGDIEDRITALEATVYGDNRK